MKLLNLYFGKEKKDVFVVKSAYEQIINELMSFSDYSNEAEHYCIINEMKMHLNFKEVEMIFNDISSLGGFEKFIKTLQEKKYYWSSRIYSDYKSKIDEAKISLSTIDFLAFLIGKKVELTERRVPRLFSEVFAEINKNLNLYIIQNNSILSIETSKKQYIPVNYAFSTFFLYEKKEALPKFKKILKDDRLQRLENSYLPEYLILCDKFFDKLNLGYIPKIDFNNNDNPIFFENNQDKYITKEEIILLINREDYFNFNGFKVEFKYLLKQNSFVNKIWFKELYFLFFNYYSNSVNNEDIEILFNCFTEINPKYDNEKINETKYKLNQVISENNIIYKFIYFNYYISCNVLIDSNQRLIELIFTFFNQQKKGFSKQTIQDVFSDRMEKRLDYNTELPFDLVLLIDLIRFKFLNNS